MSGTTYTMRRSPFDPNYSAVSLSVCLSEDDVRALRDWHYGEWQIAKKEANLAYSRGFEAAQECDREAFFDKLRESIEASLERWIREAALEQAAKACEALEPHDWIKSEDGVEPLFKAEAFAAAIRALIEPKAAA